MLKNSSDHMIGVILAIEREMKKKQISVVSSDATNPQMLQYNNLKFKRSQFKPIEEQKEVRRHAPGGGCTE